MGCQDVLNVFQSFLLEVDSVFTKVSERYPTQVRCGSGCVDCCSSFFDVSLIEAFFLEQGMRLMPEGDGGRRSFHDRAGEASKQIERCLAEWRNQGQDDQEALHLSARWRVRCPMLNTENLCACYHFRPVTCRIYGIPTAIGNQGHVCGFSGFDPGRSYDTVKLDMVNNYLLQFSDQLATALGDPKIGFRQRFFLYELGDRFGMMI